jgi:putative FmdB family regulatory protein
MSLGVLVLGCVAGQLSSDENAMPRYEFLCEKCKKPFELTMTISEREKAKVKCPKCKNTRVVPQFSGFMTQASKKS